MGIHSFRAFQLKKTLNYLIYEKEIPSCIAVAIDPVDRLEELTYNDKMNAFFNEGITSVDSS